MNRGKKKLHRGGVGRGEGKGTKSRLLPELEQYQQRTIRAAENKPGIILLQFIGVDIMTKYGHATVLINYDMDLKITIKPANRIRHPKIARDFYNSAAFYAFRQKGYYVISVFHFTVMRFHSRKAD